MSHQPLPDHTRAGSHAPTARLRDWRKGMSDNIAYALLVYTALQIVLTTGVLRAQGASVLPYVALVLLVGAIIPSCRRFERRWSRLDDVAAHDPALASRYRRDQLGLWALAIGLPFLVAGAFRLLALLFA